VSPDAIRIKVAEFAKWKGPTHPDTMEATKDFVTKNSGTWLLDPNGEISWLGKVPDYLNNSDEINKVVLSISHGQSLWLAELAALLGYPVFVPMDDAHDKMILAMVTASPAMRCEALLRAFDEWDDSK
jgi:hypothetical protein